ncbi:hypothetical protein ACTHGU_06685 [Chitinophagaceae bacterium MMS25-I14]
MKKSTIALSLLAMSLTGAFRADAQLSGPTPLGNYFMDQGLMTLNSFQARTSIGACWGGENTLWGTGYIGFNLAYDGTYQQPWTYNGDGANNAGAAIYTNAGGAMMFATVPTSSGSGGSFSNDDIRGFTRMRIDEKGKVCIGNSFFTKNLPQRGDYNLYVEGGILTEKVKVALSSSNNWADYVFAPGYRLKPLNEVESYVNANKHLPGVPSAAELVNSGGIDMNEMFSKQMEKIEELTLYMIDMKKEIETLKSENASLKSAHKK